MKNKNNISEKAYEKYQLDWNGYAHLRLSRELVAKIVSI